MPTYQLARYCVGKHMHKGKECYAIYDNKTGKWTFTDGHLTPNAVAVLANRAIIK